MKTPQNSSPEAPMDASQHDGTDDQSIKTNVENTQEIPDNYDPEKLMDTSPPLDGDRSYLDLNDQEEPIDNDFLREISENPMLYCSQIDLFLETVIYTHTV